MSAPPTPSPWPAPTLADAAAHDTDAGPGSPGGSSIEEPSHSPHIHQSLTAALDVAKRLVSPSLRAEHAALREEQRIADELGGLPPGWYAVPASEVDLLEGTGGAADHLVIGPSGVFIIRLYHRPAATVWVSERFMTVNGRSSDQLTEARFEARRVGGLLTGACGFDVTVQSVVIMVGATVQTVSRPAEVHVRAHHDLRDWLCVQPVRLAAETAAAISESVSHGLISS